MTCTFLLVSVSHLPTTSLQATESLMTMESTKPVHLIGELDIYSCIEPTLVDFAPENKRIYEPPCTKRKKERKYTESYKYVSHSRKINVFTLCPTLSSSLEIDGNEMVLHLCSCYAIQNG